VRGDRPIGGWLELMTAASTLDETLIRLHEYGPEFDGWLSNHGPMAVEAMIRHGRADAVDRWTDQYVKRLDEGPGPARPLTADEFDHAMGNPKLAGEWLATFEVELAESDWPDVLAAWWPRLLPGIAAGATHGVIRTGHAVLALRRGPTEPRVRELGHALAYWAMRWQRVPAIEPRGRADAADVLARLPTIASQSGGIRPRLAQLLDTTGFVETAESLAPADQVPQALTDLIDAVVLGYAGWAPGSPTMLVHAATAPNAVLRTLPSLPTQLWRASFAAAWSASAAVVAAYRPGTDAPARPGPAADEAFRTTVEHASEHMIKFADTALETFGRTGDERALAAIGQAVRLGA
jgi:hypothetical protein